MRLHSDLYLLCVEFDENQCLSGVFVVLCTGTKAVWFNIAGIILNPLGKI